MLAENNSLFHLKSWVFFMLQLENDFKERGKLDESLDSKQMKNIFPGKIKNEDVVDIFHPIEDDDEMLGISIQTPKFLGR